MPTTKEIHNRFGYHRATVRSAPQHNAVRQEFEALAHWVAGHLPEGREQSLALTALQEGMMWANAAIAMQNDVDDETPHQPNPLPNESPLQYLQRVEDEKSIVVTTTPGLTATYRRYKAGDEDPTPNDPSEGYCDEQSPDTLYGCTWQMRHDHPQHVAGNGRTVSAVWNA